MGASEELRRLRNFRAKVEKADPELAQETADHGFALQPETVGSPAELELETIILRRSRPVLAIRDNVTKLEFIDTADSEIWGQRLRRAQPLLDKVIPAVGRIELYGGSMSWVGTGWLVAENILVTNRHVAREFVEQKAGLLTFRTGDTGPLSAGVDFLQEIGNPNQLVFKLLKPLYVEEDSGPDIAFFEIEMTSGDAKLALPIELATDITTTERAATIGYPAYDSRTSEPELMDRIYGNVYNKKRLAPGGVVRVEAQQIIHDCTALGASSGAVVLDLDLGQAIGLHFRGRFLETNFAIRADIVRRRLAEVRSRRQVSGTSFGALKLLSIELENIRCFRSILVDLAQDGKPRPWTMLLGDNGLGKTTLLRSLVIALCDETSASALMSRMSGELLRQDTDVGRIRVQLSSSDVSDHLIWAETRLSRSTDQSISLKQSWSEGFPRERLFLCAYGALRNGFGNESYAGYNIADAVASLFDPKASLQNPELALRRLMSRGADMNLVCRRIESVLRLPENSTDFDQSGLSIRGNWGPFVPVGAIGDGYLATLAWISDLLGWTFLYRPDLLAGHVSGIVVIDEIEKHLHPRWQREIVLELSRQFPRVQFVVSTHSPLCAGGLSDLEEGEAAMYRFEQSSGSVIGEKLEPYHGWTYDQIMTSSAFGLRSARDVTTQRIVEDLNEARAKGDEQEIRAKEAALNSRSIVAADDQRDLELQAKLRRDIEELQRRVDERNKLGASMV